MEEDEEEEINDYIQSDLISLMNRYSLIQMGNKDSINSRSVVEITGEAGTGKSRLCHYFAIQTIIPKKYGGYEQRCLFLSSKSIAQEILNEFFIPSMKKKGLQENEIKLSLNRLKYIHVDFSAIEKSVINGFEIEQKDKEEINEKEENRIKTIIIDNLTALCDQEFQKEERYNYQERHAFISAFFSTMNYTILKYNLFCFCVNEVRSNFDPFNNFNRAESFKPSLGKNWESNIGTRLLLKKTKGNNSKRWIEVPFSNYIINQYFEFIIDNNGLCFI